MDHLLSALKKYFGYDDFRPGQRVLIEALLAGRDVLGVLPTGGGKSLCFQIPALVLPGLTLVVSPLLSLMKDQVDSLVAAGVPAASLSSQTSATEFRELMVRLRARELKLLYVAPERLENAGFAALLMQLDVSLIAIDEAHCISQWGHDFRPSYRAIADILKAFPQRPPVAAFTATATAQVREDIITQLALQNPLVHVASFDRPNIHFSVERPKDKLRRLDGLLADGKSSIVYCSTRKTVEQVWHHLRDKKTAASMYHAGMDAASRVASQDDFIYDRASVMVATNAFGMGIDKPDVRRVVHFNMPKNLESYYQEAGRAGRDGGPSEAVLLFSSSDIMTNAFLITQGNTPHARENLAAMVAYCNTGSCLRRHILEYFGERPDWQRCNHCSICDGGVQVTDVTVECQKILSCVYRTGQRFGTGMVIDVLRGKPSDRISQLGFENLSVWGLMKDVSAGDLRDIISLMVAQGYLQTDGETYPVLRFTTATKRLLHAEDHMALSRPLKAPSASSRSPRAAVAPTDDGEALFQALRTLRRQLAEERGVPAYVIFTDRTLADMAARHPRTDDEFLDVHGVGEAKLRDFGARFMDAIGEWERGQTIQD